MARRSGGPAGGSSRERRDCRNGWESGANHDRGGNLDGAVEKSHHPVIELVTLLASAGGLEAVSIVLRDLPTKFPAAVVVQQHLGGLSSVLPTILSRQTPHRVGWARDGEALAPGQVFVGPPGKYLELTPDGRCRLRGIDALAERRFDVLLASVARSYGARSVAVVLSGSGQDGAVGTVAMTRAGGIVIAQSPETALYSSMPIAAARAGATVVLPIYEIGQALADIVGGAPPPGCQWQENRWIANTSVIPARAAGGGDSGTPAAGTSMEPGISSDVEPGGVAWLSPTGAANTTAARAEMARRRAAELRRRRRDLSAGLGATPQTVMVARRRAAESLRRAQLAHRAARQAAKGAAARRDGDYRAALD